MRSFIITSIAGPNDVMRGIAARMDPSSDQFIVIGDTKSPADFHLEGCGYYGMERQLGLGSRFAAACPTRHYARKNIGYLLAIQAGAETIIETDDDNFPEDAFFEPRQPEVEARIIDRPGWANVYRLFHSGKEPIWPRGLPLDEIKAFDGISAESFALKRVYCPIQQHLADSNPDVDAIYRLVGALPFNFERGRNFALAPGTWCPFNSQNTTWWPDAYPLLYLPAYCSFRMTDIWRSLVAERIAAANGWHILFGPPTVSQERNEHNLMRDFADEVPGYLNNERIRRLLEDLPIDAGRDRLDANLRRCYAALVAADLVGGAELELLPLFLEEAATDER